MKRHVIWPVALGVMTTTIAVPLTVGAANAAPQRPAQPVEVTNFTTETTQVFAQPDGTYELTSYREPVRVKRGKGWVPVDTDVARTSEGRLAPGATPADVTFSSGGSGPLVTMGKGEDKFALSWDGQLPTPKVNGEVVTYPDVRPGADLVLTATRGGFTHVLVIKDEKAARAVIAEPVMFSASSPKLKFKRGKSGTTDLVNGDGDTVFAAGNPVVWDSRGAAETTAQDPAESKVAEATTETRHDGNSLSMELAPPAALVEDPKTEYPLFLDPPYEKTDNYYSTVHSKGWNILNDSTQPMRVGNCGWAECNTSTQGVARSFFQFDVMPLRHPWGKAEIHSATVAVKQTHNATSSAQPVKLMRTPSIPTSWGGTIGAHIETKSSAAGGGSNAEAWINFTGSGVKNYLQSYADGTGNDLNIRFALVAEDEGDRNQWKKFNNNPKLSLRYSYPPTTPVTSVPGAANCMGLYTGSAPKLQATSLAVGDAGVPLTYTLQVESLDTTQVLPASQTSTKSATSNNAVTWSLSGLNNGRWRFRVKATHSVTSGSSDSSDSAWSAWTTFTVDTVNPALPEAYSPTHPQNHWGAATNSAARFKLAGDSTSFQFHWAVDQEPAVQPNENCAVATGAGTARKGTILAGNDLVLTGLTTGEHYLKVSAVDAAQNISAPITYKFRVAPSVNKPNGSIASGTNVHEFEAMNGQAGTSDMTVTTGAIPSHSGSGVTLKSSMGTASAPQTANFTFTPEATASHALGVRYQTNAFGGQMRLVLTDPGQDATSTSDDVVHRFYAPNGGEVAVSTAGTASSLFSLNKYANFTDYLNGDGINLVGGRQYKATFELVNGGGVYTMFLILDSLVAAPINAGPFASLRDSFNSQALSHGTAVSGFELQPTGQRAFSAASLGTRGFASGSTLSVPVAGDSTPATFQVPASIDRTATASQQAFDLALAKADNTVANGQKILLAKNPTTNKFPTGNYLDLLVTSTCRSMESNPARAFSVGITIEGQNAPVDIVTQAVPVWLSAAAPTTDPSAPGKVVPGVKGAYVNGTTAQAGEGSMYVLRFPLADSSIQTNDEILSVTLPNMGTVPGTPCGQLGSQALHVFAMSVN